MSDYDYHYYDDEDGEAASMRAAIEYDEQVNRPLPFQNLDLGITRTVDEFVESSVDIAAGVTKGVFGLFGW